MSASESAAAPGETATRGIDWGPISILAAAQFVMVLDSSVMNVSISQIVEDLDTTVQGVQLAITMYALVMAALMLAGAKLGDILGRDKAFAIGLAIYGVGSFTTAISPNLGVLLLGWSLDRGDRGGDRHPRDRLADRRHVRGTQPGGRLRDHRRGRRRRDRRRAPDRRLGDDRVQLALRVRGRGGDRDRVLLMRGRLKSFPAAIAATRSSTSSGSRSRPQGSGWPSSGSSRAVSGGWSNRAAR